MPLVASWPGALAVHRPCGAVAVGLGGLERLRGEDACWPRRARRRRARCTPPAMELLRPAVRVIMSATADCVNSCWRLGSSPDCTSPHAVAGKRDEQDALHRRRSAPVRLREPRARRAATSSATAIAAARRAAHGSTARSGSIGSNACSSRSPRLGQHAQEQQVHGRGRPHRWRPARGCRRALPLGSTRSSTSHARPPSAADAASAGRNACGKNPCPTRLRNTVPNAERAQEVCRAVPESERRDLRGVVLEREAADDHHRGADERARRPR